MNNKIIIYIIGNNRSGSTLLDYILSCHPESFSTGELHHLQSYVLQSKGMGALYDWKCNCSKIVQECDFWHDVIEKEQVDESFITRLPALYEDKKEKIKLIWYRYLLNNYTPTERIKGLGREFAHNTWGLYSAIFEKTGKSILIDSSKSGLEAYFLNRYKQGNIKFLLLERDLRAIANSKAKRTHNVPESIRKSWNPARKSIIQHIISSYKIRYQNRQLVKKIKKENGVVLKVDYETLTSEIDNTIKNIVTSFQIPTFSPPHMTNTKKKITHELCGSPSRTEKRPIETDLRWKENFKGKPIESFIGGILNKV